MLCLKTSPLWNGTTRNLQMYLFSLRFLCAAPFPLSCRILLFSLPTTKYFFKFLYSEITGKSAWWSCLGPLGVVSFSSNWRSSELDSFQFWNSDIQDLPTSCRKFLYFMFLFVFSVLYTKNVLKRAQFSRYSTTFWPFYSFPQKWVKTEVLVCPHIYSFRYTWHCMYSCVFLMMGGGNAWNMWNINKNKWIKKCCILLDVIWNYAKYIYVCVCVRERERERERERKRKPDETGGKWTMNCNCVAVMQTITWNLSNLRPSFPALSWDNTFFKPLHLFRRASGTFH